MDVDLVKLLLGGTRVDWDSPSDGKTGVPGGVRSLITQNSHNNYKLSNQ